MSSTSPHRPDPDLTTSRAAFWQMLKRIAVLAAAVDVIFLIVFWVLGLPVVALANLISVATYVVAYVLIGRRRNLPAVILMWLEVLIHSGYCTLLFGWDTGVHYFLLVFLPAVAVSRSARHAVGAMAFVLAAYLALDLATQLVPVTHVLPPQAIVGLRWISITVVFVMFGYTGRYYVERVLETERRLRTLATTDSLSGLLNRRRFTELAEVEVRRAGRQGADLAVVLADIDHFKQVNDQHGHAAGDRVIQHVSRLLQAELRPHDLVGRWGGEEFIVLLPGTSVDGARVAAERIRAAIEQAVCDLDGKPLRVTLSLGVHGVSLDLPFGHSVQHADDALYAAKGVGRNTVVVCAAPPRRVAAFA